MKANPFERTELRMKAEVHSAKAMLLLAGVSKLADPQIFGKTLFDQVYMDTCIAALQDAKKEAQQARAILAALPKRRRQGYYR